VKEYDYIIAGAGCAGLSLAVRLCQHPVLRQRSVLIIDKDEKKANDRTWCFWSKEATAFDSIVYRRWNQISFHGSDEECIYRSNTYSYQLIRGSDFYAHAKKVIRQNPNIQWEKRHISILNQDDEGPYLIADGEKFRAKYIFNSCFIPSDLNANPIQSPFLWQHFTGWVIETQKAVFNPHQVRLMDFRTPQQGDARFFYLLPFSEKRALVEYTLFSKKLLEPEVYEAALKSYIRDQLEIEDFSIKEREFGAIPMTNAPLSSSAGDRIIDVGTLGGAVKPTTGYAFLRIQEQIRDIIQRLEQGVHPQYVIKRKPRYAFYDSLLLNILSRRGEWARPIFTRLFIHNHIDRIFAFLDERASLWQEARIFAFLPMRPFLKAIWETQRLKKALPDQAAAIAKKIP